MTRRSRIALLALAPAAAWLALARVGPAAPGVPLPADPRLARAADARTASSLALAQRYLAEDKGFYAGHALNGVRWDHRERPEFRLAEHRLRHAGRRELVGHLGNVTAVAWSPDGTRIASAGTHDGAVRLWDARTGECVRLLEPHPNGATAVAWSPDGRHLASAGGDRHVRIWDARTGALLHDIGGEVQLSSLAWSLDGTRLAATGEGAGVPRVWDARTWAEPAALRDAGEGHDRAVAWSPDGTRLAAVGKSGLALWDPRDGAEVATPRPVNGDLYGVAYSPDGRHLGTAGAGGAWVWDAATGREAVVLRGRFEWADALAWSADGTRLATAGHAVEVWNAFDGRRESSLRGTGPRATAVSWSPDGARLAAAYHDDRPLIWDAVAGDDPPEADGGPDSWNVAYLAYSPDGRRIAAACKDGTARVWDARTVTPRFSFRHDDAVRGVAFSHEGTRLATACEDGFARVWELATGETVAVVGFPGTQIRSVSWSPDGARLVTALDGNAARVWDVALQGLLFPLGDPMTTNAFDAAWSPRGDRIATADLDGTVRIYDGRTGEEQVVCRGHSGNAIRVRWSPDGSRLASGSNDGSARVWNPATGQTVAVCRGAGGAERTVDWTPDGTRLVVPGHPEAGLWDARTGDRVGSLEVPDYANVAVFAPDGNALAVAGKTAIRFWPLAPPAESLNLIGHSLGSESAWSRDGRTVVCRTQDHRRVEQFDTRTGEIVPTDTPLPDLTPGAVSPDGTREVVWGAGGLSVRRRGLAPPPRPGLLFPPRPDRLRRDLAAARADGDFGRALAACDALARLGEESPRAEVLADARREEPAQVRWALAEAADRQARGRPFAVPVPPTGAPVSDVREAVALAALADADAARALLPAARSLAERTGSPDDRLGLALVQVRVGSDAEARANLEAVRRERGRVRPECEYGLAVLAARAGDAPAATRWRALGDAARFVTPEAVPVAALASPGPLSALGTLAAAAGGDARLRAWRRAGSP